MNKLLRCLPALTLCFLLASAAFAQAPENGKFRFGLRGGLSAANLLFTEGPYKYAGHCPDGPTKCFGNGDTDFYTFDYEGGLGHSRLGLAAGVYVERLINERLSVEVGVNYEQKGINLVYESHRKDINNNNFEIREWRYYERDLRNDYLVVPLVAKYKINPASRFYVTGGVFAGFLMNSVGVAQDSVLYLSAYAGQHSSGQMQKMAHAADKEWTSKFDAGLVAGGGTSWPIGKGFDCSVDARLNIGLLKVDAKYNNRFEKQAMPPAMGYGGSHSIVSETYYRGLNSQARNINLALTAGVSRSF